MLLELCRHLIASAQRDETDPIPIVFNLASWGAKRKPLAEWILDELDTMYQVPPTQAAAWLAQSTFVYLLDGLDEVAPEHRTLCIQAINVFRSERLNSMVICCRRQQYDELDTKLTALGAILLQPLSAKQVNDYLHRAGPQFNQIRTLINESPEWQKLAETPLMLNVMILAYGPESSATPTAGIDPKHQLFDQFIRSMFKRRSKAASYTPVQTVYWLNWLSNQMKERNITEFRLEEIQSHWIKVVNRGWQARLADKLGPKRAKPIIIVVIDILVWGLLGGTILGLIGLLAGGLILGLIGFLIGCVMIIRSELQLLNKSRITLKTDMHWDWHRFKINLLNILMLSLKGSLLLGLHAFHIGLSSVVLNGIFSHAPPEALEEDFILLLMARSLSVLSDAYIDIVTFGLSFGVSNIQTLGLALWLVGALISVLRRELSVIWIINMFSAAWLCIEIDWPLSVTLARSLGVGVDQVLRMEFKQFLGIDFDQLLSLATLQFVVLSAGLTVGLSVGLIVAIFRGLDFQTSNVEMTKPNQAIQRSGAMSLIAGIGFGLIIGSPVGFIIGLMVGLSVGLSIGLLAGLIMGVFVGLIVGLKRAYVHGGEAYVGHYLFRYFLYLNGDIPFRYVRFLDYATDRIFLHRVGPSYLFIHRLIMEHFASLTDEDIERITAGLD